MIETKRLSFRPWREADAEELFRFVDNPASGKVMENCGFRDTGDINWLSELYKGDERPVKIMRLDYSSDSQDNQALAKLKLLQDD
jgi:RimJ/RimL family protein N-acetyltransferase